MGKKIYGVIFIVSLLIVGAFIAIGYASVTGSLSVQGKVEIEPAQYDVYISSYSPTESAGVSVKHTLATTFFAKVSGSGTAIFTITVTNQSNKIYVFERVIDGAETGIDGVYAGSDITYKLVGLSPLQEIDSKGGTITFRLEINVPARVTAENYVLLFNFIEKTGTEILPGGDVTEAESDTVTETVTESETGDDTDTSVGADEETEDITEPIIETEKETEAPGDNDDDDHLHNDFLGLVEALLSDENNCLNDTNLIYNAVRESLTSNKRPSEDAPILHCHVNSVSGGTMSAIAEAANINLTENLHFAFEADPDNNNRLYIYMYYGDECTTANTGSEILCYKQVVTRGSDGVWFADGTYIGRATVGEFFGGGKNGKDVLTVNPYSWKSGAPKA